MRESPHVPSTAAEQIGKLQAASNVRSRCVSDGFYIVTRAGVKDYQCGASRCSPVVTLGTDRVFRDAHGKTSRCSHDSRHIKQEDSTGRVRSGTIRRESPSTSGAIGAAHRAAPRISPTITNHIRRGKVDIQNIPVVKWAIWYKRGAARFGSWPESDRCLRSFRQCGFSFSQITPIAAAAQIQQIIGEPVRVPISPT